MTIPTTFKPHDFRKSLDQKRQEQETAELAEAQKALELDEWKNKINRYECLSRRFKKSPLSRAKMREMLVLRQELMLEEKRLSTLAEDNGTAPFIGFNVEFPMIRLRCELLGTADPVVLD